MLTSGDLNFMLPFFRKYQRIVFLFTTVIVIASFVFFGTMNSMGDSFQEKEEHLVQAVDGSSISRQKVERMVQFLSSSQLDLREDRTQSVNLLNDGVLEKDFLGSSLGSLLAGKVFPYIEKDLQTSLEKIVEFRPYRHATAPFIGADSVWAQFSPEATQLAAQLSRSIPSVKTFEILSKAYLKQQQIPSSFIRRVLAYQEGQASETEKDTSLPYADVSLFGLHSSKAWFGEIYIRAAAEVILNASAKAKKQGFSIATQVIRQDLVAQVKQAASMMSQEIDPSTDFYQVFLAQIRNRGMTEPECIDLWRDISLFRKLCKVSSDSALVDPSSLPVFNTALREQALVEKFSLPSHLQLRDFSSLMKLYLYTDSVALSKTRSKDFLLGFPKEFLSLAEIEKKAPDLVQREYELEYAQLDVKKAAIQVGLKETWNFQTEELGWSFLTKRFPALSNVSAKTKEERWQALEKLDQTTRKEVDKLSREQIFALDKNRVKALLEAQETESRIISISASGFELPFKEMKDLSAFVSLLEDPSIGVQEKLSFYTQDQQHYYKIHVVKRSPTKKVQTFAEANSSGALRRMLDKKLENAYFEVRKKDSLAYMQKDGSWKPLSEVKDKVGLAIFGANLKNIALEYTSFSGKEPTAEELSSPEFYVRTWMLYPMKDRLEKAKQGIFEEEKEHPLQSQWQLVREKEKIGKKEQEQFVSLPFEEGVWSSILPLASGKSCFVHVLQKLGSAPITQEEIETVSAPLKQEAFKHFCKELLDEIEEKKAFCFEKKI